VRLNKDGFFEARAITLEGYNQAETYIALQNFALLPYDLVVVPESDRSQFMRLIQDVNTAITPYFQIRLLELVSRQ
jgi:hypothetical protein